VELIRKEIEAEEGSLAKNERLNLLGFFDLSRA